MEEKIFYEIEDVKVTNSRFVVAGATYPIANISSVKSSFKKVNKAIAYILVVFGILCLLASATAPSGGQAGPAILALLCIGFGYPRFEKAKAVHTVVLATSGGEVQAYSSQNEDVIAAIVAALNDAIVHRG